MWYYPGLTFSKLAVSDQVFRDLTATWSLDRIGANDNRATSRARRAVRQPRLIGTGLASRSGRFQGKN
jgi:hypothetical protein